MADVPGVGGVEPDGEVVVEVGGATQLARPTRPVAPTAPTDLLVVDVSQPLADWTRLLDAPLPPVGALAALDAAIDGLLHGRTGGPSPQELLERLAALDRRSPEDARGESGPRQDDPSPDGPDRARRVAEATRATEEADEQRRAAEDLRAERVALDDDLVASEEAAAVARAEERRLADELAGPEPVPSTRQLTAEALALRELGRALVTVGDAADEVAAASNTATVVGRALARGQRGGRRALERLQPVLLTTATALIGVAVVLIVRGASGWGIAVAAAAAVVAGLALLATARPAAAARSGSERSPVATGHSPRRTAIPEASPEELRRRLERAEADKRTWEAQRSARAARVAELATPLGLTPNPDAGDLAARREELERSFKARSRHDEASRRRATADGAALAAERSRRTLIGQRAVLEARAEALDRRWASWRGERGLPAWSTPQDALDHYRAEAAGQLVGAEDQAQDPAELRQTRQGLLDQLGRLSRELDRLVLARWLLTRAAGATEAARTAATTGEPASSSVPPTPLAAGPPETRGPVAEAAVARPDATGGSASDPAAGDGARPAMPAPSRLRQRTTELLSLASGGRVVGVRVELPDRPVLSLAGGGELVLGPDRDARVLADVCAVLATGELAAGPERWPLVVTGLDAWPDGAGRQVVRDLLTEVAGRTQVLVLAPATNGANGANGTAAP